MEAGQISPAVLAPEAHTEKGGLFRTLRRDIAAVFERDPAARSVMEVFFLYPGLHAIWGHRLSHWLWTHRLKLLGRWVSQLTRNLTGIEIHPGAIIGPGLFIDHGMGVVIGETAEVGEDVTMYHGVTLGGTSLNKGKRHPTLGDRVVIGAGAKVLGAITIGEDTRIGANAVVVKSMPSNSVVIGVPGQVVKRSHIHHAGDAPDLNHNAMPDVVGVTLIQLLERVDSLENRVDGQPTQPPADNRGVQKPHIHAPRGDAWDGQDFSI
jgi:serine O-acetyltransferase